MATILRVVAECRTLASPAGFDLLLQLFDSTLTYRSLYPGRLEVPALVDLITGAVITEAIFGVPGIGKFFVESIFSRDYSMIMGTTLIYALLIVLANMMVDVSYGVLDPRIRSQG